MSQKFSWPVRVAGAAAVVGMLAVAGVAYAQVPTFSQSSVTVGAGQSTSITSANGVSVYMESNSSPTVVSVSANGTQVSLTGLQPGTAGLTLCAVGTASDCANLSVIVQVGTVSGISFSQNNLTVPSNSSQSVTLTGGGGTYTVSGNSNTTVISTSLSGNTLTVSGLAAGGATVTVCDAANMSTCATLSVTVGASTSGTSGLTLSQASVSLVVGANQVVNISSGNGIYSISNNSNSSVVSVGMSGTTGIIVAGMNAGSATITVCDTSNPVKCGTLAVTVTGAASNANQGVTFSTADPTLAVGQTLDVQLSGGATTYVVFWNQNDNIVQASMAGGSTLALYGAGSGTDSLTICATLGGCSPLSVTVTGSSTTTTTTTATNNTPSITATQPTTAAPSAAQPATAVANAALLSEIQAVQTALTQALLQIQSIQAQINQLEAQVSAGSGSAIGASANVSSGSGTFTELLAIGSQDVQVTALQNKLSSLGFYSGPVTGYYGALTASAVTKYQTAHGIQTTGEVGPGTRAALNAGN